MYDIKVYDTKRSATKVQQKCNKSATREKESKKISVQFIYCTSIYKTYSRIPATLAVFVLTIVADFRDHISISEFYYVPLNIEEAEHFRDVRLLVI